MSNHDRLEYADELRPTPAQIVDTIRGLRQRIERGEVRCASCGKPATKIAGSSAALVVLCDFHYRDASLNRRR